jgi:hypothetical protein
VTDGGDMNNTNDDNEETTIDYTFTLRKNQNGVQNKEEVIEAVKKILMSNTGDENKVKFMTLLVEQLIREYDIDTKHVAAKKVFTNLKEENKSVIKWCCAPCKCCYRLLEVSLKVMVYITLIVAFGFVCINLLRQSITG